VHKTIKKRTIMKHLSCKAMGATDCDFVATGSTDEEVKQKMMEHAASAHPEKMQSMTPEQMMQAGKMMDQLLAAQ
jgi:predicted small metal-binding protein